MITEIDIRDQPVLDALNRLLRAGQEMNPVMEAIGMELESRTSSRFETQTDPNGAPWAAWKPSTVESYPNDGNRRKLDRYGDMLAKLTHLAQGNTVQVGFGESVVSRKYGPISPALFHETGTSNMARRGVLTDGSESLGAGDEEAVLRLLNDHFGRSFSG